MDRKAFIIILLCVAFFFGVWNPLINKYFPPVPIPPADTNQVATLDSSATNMLATPTGTNAAQTIAPTTAANPANTNAFRSSAEIQAAAAAPAAPVLTLPEDGKEQLITLENDLAKYTFSSLGGGIKQIELKKYPSSVSRASKKEVVEEQDLMILNEGVAVPIFTALGTDTNLSTRLYSLSKKDDSSVQATLPLADGTLLTKTFTLSSNYLFKAKITLSNTSSVPVQTDRKSVV